MSQMYSSVVLIETLKEYPKLNIRKKNVIFLLQKYIFGKLKCFLLEVYFQVD